MKHERAHEEIIKELLVTKQTDKDEALILKILAQETVNSVQMIWSTLIIQSWCFCVLCET